MNKGWKKEPYRHGLAGRGIKTTNMMRAQGTTFQEKMGLYWKQEPTGFGWHIAGVNRNDEKGRAFLEEMVGYKTNLDIDAILVEKGDRLVMYVRSEVDKGEPEGAVYDKWTQKHGYRIGKGWAGKDAYYELKEIPIKPIEGIGVDRYLIEHVGGNDRGAIIKFWEAKPLPDGKTEYNHVGEVAFMYSMNAKEEFQYLDSERAVMDLLMRGA